VEQSNKIRVGLFGLGRTGQEVAQQLILDEEVELLWIMRSRDTESSYEPFQGVPVLPFGKTRIDGLMQSSGVNFIVDFSAPDTCLSYADAAATHDVGIVSAISAYSEVHLDKLKSASATTKVFHSPNITLGVNFVMMAGKVLRKLAPHAGVEVVEEHFHGKQEVSGTAVRIAELLELDPAKQVNSVRVGGILGRHEIIFGFPYQTVRLMHDTISRAAFGQGALFALKELNRRPNGFYTMEQLVMDGFREAMK
jgi:4-hydroxy-tetrahydrodipicolinate reductase